MKDSLAPVELLKKDIVDVVSFEMWHLSPVLHDSCISRKRPCNRWGYRHWSSYSWHQTFLLASSAATIAGQTSRGSLLSSTCSVSTCVSLAWLLCARFASFSGGAPICDQGRFQCAAAATACCCWLQSTSLSSASMFLNYLSMAVMRSSSATMCSAKYWWRSSCELVTVHSTLERVCRVASLSTSILLEATLSSLTCTSSLASHAQLLYPQISSFKSQLTGWLGAFWIK